MRILAFLNNSERDKIFGFGIEISNDWELESKTEKEEVELQLEESSSTKMKPGKTGNGTGGVGGDDWTSHLLRRLRCLILCDFLGIRVEIAIIDKEITTMLRLEIVRQPNVKKENK